MNQNAEEFNDPDLLFTPSSSQLPLGKPWEGVQPTEPYGQTTNYRNEHQTAPNQRQYTSWDDVQPTQPYSQGTKKFGVDDDEGTDGGKTYSTLEKIYSGEGGDQMSYQSYGYSLDDGINSKQSDDGFSKPSDTPTAQRDSNTLADLHKEEFERASVDISLGSPGESSQFSGLTNEDASLKQILKANLPQGKFDINDDSGSTMEYDPLDSLKLQLYERSCIAPPGKLGVIIDTTKLGPVIYQVKDESPLRGLVFPGDRIIGVDDIDTQGMTASNITKIMAHKANVERRLTVASRKKL